MQKVTRIEGWFGWGVDIGKAGAFRTDAPFGSDVMKASLLLHVPGKNKMKRKNPASKKESK